MPHQCLNCNEIYDNSSDAIIKGCPKCGKKLFLYIKKVPSKKDEIELSSQEKEFIMDEINSITKIEEHDTPIILKLENIRVIKPGKYEIDINQLMKKDKPIIFKVQDGTYIIDLNSLKNIKS